jgi:hypothetical protein
MSHFSVLSSRYFATDVINYCSNDLRIFQPKTTKILAMRVITKISFLFIPDGWMDGRIDIVRISFTSVTAIFYVITYKIE